MNTGGFRKGDRVEADGELATVVKFHMTKHYGPERFIQIKFDSDGKREYYAPDELIKISAPKRSENGATRIPQ